MTNCELMGYIHRLNNNIHRLNNNIHRLNNNIIVKSMVYIAIILTDLHIISRERSVELVSKATMDSANENDPKDIGKCK